MANLALLVWGALMPGVRELPVAPWLRTALESGVESVCLFADATGTRAITSAAIAELRACRADVLVATDEETGEVTRLQARDGSSFLSPAALGRIDDVAVTAASARLAGALMRATGLDWTLAPVADVNCDPRNPVIGVRSFGADPAVVSAHVVAWVDGLRSAGVIGCAKHFPGHGDTHVDSHESLPTVTADAGTVVARDLEPFRRAIAAGVPTVMTGHVLVPALDPDAPASLSRGVTTGILRDRLGFDGVVVTDAVEMGAVAGADRSRLAAAAVATLRAGADVVCIGAADQERALADCAAAIFSAVDDGTLDVGLLRTAARRRAVLRDSFAAEAARTPAFDARDDEQRLAAAASRSLECVGEWRLAEGPVDVVRVAAGPGFAAGHSAWGVAPVLSQLGRTVRVVTVDDVMAGRTSDALVVETRDPWKVPAVEAALASVVANKPDAVVVDVGWPGDLPPGCRGRIATWGTGRLSSALAAAALLDADPVPVALDVIRAAREEER